MVSSGAVSPIAALHAFDRAASTLLVHTQRVLVPTPRWASRRPPFGCGSLLCLVCSHPGRRSTPTRFAFRPLRLYAHPIVRPLAGNSQPCPHGHRFALPAPFRPPSLHAQLLAVSMQMANLHQIFRKHPRQGISRARPGYGESVHEVCVHVSVGTPPSATQCVTLCPHEPRCRACSLLRFVYAPSRPPLRSVLCLACSASQ